MALLPGFGEQTVPVRVKLALALAFTVIVTPGVAPALDPLPAHRIEWLILTETVVGLVTGIGLRLLLMALQTAGSIAAQATSLSQILGTAGVTPLPAMGHILVVGGLALAMMLGLHVQVARLLVLTYGVFPPGALPSPPAVSEWGVAQVSAAFSLAFALSAPFVIVSLVYNLTLGIINRAMPQLMVVFVGAPVITLGGLVLLFLLAPAMLTHWSGALQGFLANPFGAR
jgi:flagellar biosynthetic protein FliR